MAKRLLDLSLAAGALIVLSPLLLLAAVSVWLDDRGPILFRSIRAGRRGAPFEIVKFRTMRGSREGPGDRVTSSNDSRVTRVGRVLRASKIDELPQLINILKGEMSIVGPRPEDAGIVAEHYTTGQRETLGVRPGLASPGSLYNYTHAEGLIVVSDPESAYLTDVLPVKLALERVYVHRASVRYDIEIIIRTIIYIASRLAGRKHFPDPPELDEALQKYVEPVRNGPHRSGN